MLSARARARLQKQIDAAEGAAYIPRIVRENILKQMEKDAEAEGTDLSKHKGYLKLKALDDSISTLRTQLT